MLKEQHSVSEISYIDIFNVYPDDAFDSIMKVRCTGLAPLVTQKCKHRSG